MGTGTKEDSQVLGAFGVLEFTMLRPVLSWSAFLNLKIVDFFNFPIFFRAAVSRGYGGTPVLSCLDLVRIKTSVTLLTLRATYGIFLF
jgi:hypothetical protein